ncbi:MAG: hypothetical protein ACRD0J_11845, partial [Acidimicrobiales bacterium]
AALDARAVGVAAWRLGAGRSRKEDPVSAGAGVVCLARPGQVVDAGQPVLELWADDPDRFPRAEEALAGAVVVTPPDEEPTGPAAAAAAAPVIERIGPAAGGGGAGVGRGVRRDQARFRREIDERGPA